VDDSTLHERLVAVAGARSFRELGRMTGTNAETVRRYMRGQAPSIDFIAGLCDATGTNVHWLITGQGAQRGEDARVEALKRADAGELLSAVATTIERAVERLDRLERYVQTIETRLSAIFDEEDADAEDDAAAERAERVGAIADAVSQRSPPDAD
jgi:transcriptional regulator with XRE-family HTH domain